MNGKGAEITGGRWSAVGTPMLYVAPTIALSCLETIVHLDGSMSIPLNRFLVKIEVQEDIWKKATKLVSAAHIGWDTLPAGAVSLEWGTNWCKKNSSLLAFIPSVIVPEEFIVLLNTRHVSMPSLKVTKIRKWNYDPRALGQKL